MECNNGGYDTNQPVSLQVRESVEATVWALLQVNHRYKETRYYQEKNGEFQVCYKDCLRTVHKVRKSKGNYDVETRAVKVCRERGVHSSRSCPLRTSSCEVSFGQWYST